MNTAPASLFSRVVQAIDQFTTPPDAQTQIDHARVARALCVHDYNESKCTAKTDTDEWLRTAYQRLVQWMPPTIVRSEQKCTRFMTEVQCTTYQFLSGQKRFELRCDELGSCSMTSTPQFTNVPVLMSGMGGCGPAEIYETGDAVHFSDVKPYKADYLDNNAHWPEDVNIGWRFERAHAARDYAMPNCFDHGAGAADSAAYVYLRSIQYEGDKVTAFPHNLEHNMMMDALLDVESEPTSFSTFAPRHWKWVHASWGFVGHLQADGSVHWHSQYSDSWDETGVSLIADATNYTAQFRYLHPEYGCWAVYEKSGDEVNFYD